MSELEGYEQTINSKLDQLQKEIQKLDVVEINKRTQVLKSCQIHCKSIKTLLESYELEIQNLDKQIAAVYLSSYKELNQKFLKLQSELEYKKNEASAQENLFKDKVPIKPKEMDREQMIQLGDETQAKGLQAVQRMQGNIDQAQQIGNEILTELDRQIVKLDSMYDTVKDTQSIIKRSQKYLNYFARQVYTDKLLMCLIGLVFIGLIVLMILSATGYGGNMNTPTYVKDTLKSSSTNSTSKG
ncbi:hypothetical protein pb186bvf_007605 [Paramecium bursaria]